MGISVVGVRRGADGVWEPAEQQVFSSNDLTEVNSLDGVPTVEGALRWQGKMHHVTIYLRADPMGWVASDVFDAFED